MSKPSTLPEWADGGSALITVPTSGKKLAGWSPRERPPAQYLNWWMNLVYLWIVYLSNGANAGWHDAIPWGQISGGGASPPAFSTGAWSFQTGVAASTIKPVPICLRVGDTITDIRIHGGATALTISTGDFVIVLKKYLAGTVTTLATIDASSGTGTLADTVVTLASAETVVDHASYYFEVAHSGTNNYKLASIGYKIGEP